MSSSQSSASTSSKCHLLSLPQELRHQIYSYCLPKPRILRIALDFKTQHAHLLGPFSRIPLLLHICQDSRVFALSIFQPGFASDPVPESAGGSHESQADDDDEDEEDDEEDDDDDFSEGEIRRELEVYGDEEYIEATLQGLRKEQEQPIPNQNSRTFYWNPSIDTIYLLSPNLYSHDNLTYLQRHHLHSTSFTNFSHLQNLFSRVQNIALKCTPSFLRVHFNLSRPQSWSQEPFDPWFLPMLSELPNLKSLEFLIEPMGRYLGQPPRSRYYALSSTLSSPPTSIILASPREDVKVGHFNMTALKIEDCIFDSLVAFDREWGEEIEVNVSVMVIKKFKDNAWCLRSERNKEWWSVRGALIHAGSTNAALHVASEEAEHERRSRMG
jgi:hypothetical protein